MNDIQIVRILHLEDDESDMELVARELRQVVPACEVRVAESRSDFFEALDEAEFDMVLSDSEIVDIDGLSALQITRQRYPGIPFLFVSGCFEGKNGVETLKSAGATDCVLKSELFNLGPALQSALRKRDIPPSHEITSRYIQGMERLVAVVQDLSLARDLDTVMAIVRRAARELTGADGATFVLRDKGEMCFYADEEAIAPLWKGQRFPMSTCISGWAMLNRQNAVIEDIYVDPRIPHDAYRPTFVKSLVMVPIRTQNPLGAIGNYWAERRQPTPEEVKLLQALADTTAVALENVQLYEQLEQRVRDRTAELQIANKELEAFSYAVSHDLRAPLRHVNGYSQMLLEDCADDLSAAGQNHIRRIRKATEHMGQLIEALLRLSRTTQTAVRRDEVDLSRMAQEIASSLQGEAPDRRVDFVIAPDLSAFGDPRLLRVAMENLLTNAWKFTGKLSHARIEVGSITGADGKATFYVKDNGAGFDMERAGKLFGVFKRLHSEREFPGTGVGLATVQRIIHKHGGHIRAESAVDQGAGFYFTLA